MRVKIDLDKYSKFKVKYIGIGTIMVAVLFLILAVFVYPFYIFFTMLLMYMSGQIMCIYYNYEKFKKFEEVKT